MTLHIAVIYGSVREVRQGIKAARFIKKKLEAKDIKVDFVDAKAYDLPLLDKMYKEYKAGEAPQNLESLAETLRQADGYVVVTGEYNHSIPPGLKNLLDHFQTEYLFKPAGIACYSAGMFGGMRAAVHVRAILGELGMATISSIFPVPKVQDAFDEEGNPRNEDYHQFIKKFLDELEWYGHALKEARGKGTPF